MEDIEKLSVREILDIIIARVSSLEWGITEVAKIQTLIKLKEAKFWLNQSE